MKLTHFSLLLTLVFSLLVSLGNVQASPLTVATATVRPSDTRWPTNTLRPTDTRWPTVTRTPTRTATITKTPTITRTPINTGTPTATPMLALLNPPTGSTPISLRPLFDWSDYPGATRYEIVISRYASFSYPLVYTTPGTSSFTPASDLPANATLYWKVRADGPSYSAWFSSSFTSPNPPSVPALLSPAANQLLYAYTPTLDWEPSTLPAGTLFDKYQLEVDNNADFSSPFIRQDIAGRGNHYFKVAAPLETNKTFYWRVRATNSLGQVSAWKSSYFRTALKAPSLYEPTLPHDLRPRFDWEDVAGATGYGLQASTHADMTSPVINLAVKTSEYLPALDLPRNVTIFWRVRTHGTNISAWSRAAFTSPNPPDVPILLSPANAATTSLNPTLDWNAAVLPTGTFFAFYKLQVDDNADFSSPLVDQTISNRAAHVFTVPGQTTLQPATVYYWRVCAVNNVPHFSSWAARSFKTAANAATATPITTPTFTPSPTSIPGIIDPNPDFRQLQMFTSTRGLAYGAETVYRTLDGGRTWYNITPASVKEPVSGYFVNPTVGWVISNGTIYRTGDGGAIWAGFDAPFSYARLRFINGNIGYALVPLGAAMNKEAVALFKTTDDGQTWTLMYINDPTVSGAGTSLPLGGHKYGFNFRDETNGWIGGDIPTPGYSYLYRTRDSGASWERQILPLPAGYESAYVTTTAPTFSSATEAVLPVWLGTTSGRDLFIYASHDGGETWTPSAAFARNAEFPDFTSAMNVIAWNWNGYFLVTSDAGTTWSQVTPNTNFTSGIRNMDFVSATTGWVILANPDDSTGLYRTTDGAKTWVLLAGSGLSVVETPTSTPTPTATVTPSATPTPVSAITYSVIFVAADDVLNVRSDAGVSNPIMATLAPDATGIMATGQRQMVGSDAWAEILIPGGTGWVNFYYLTEQVSPEAFAADPRPQVLVNTLKEALNNRDGSLLSGLVHQKHGLSIFYWKYGNDVHYTPATVSTIFTDTTPIDWGPAPGSGINLVGTFDEKIRPLQLDVLNSNYEASPNEAKHLGWVVDPWPLPRWNFYELYRPSTQLDTLDWRAWLVGFEYINGQPYITRLIHFQWEP